MYQGLKNSSSNHWHLQMAVSAWPTCHSVVLCLPLHGGPATSGPEACCVVLSQRPEQGPASSWQKPRQPTTSRGLRFPRAPSLHPQTSFMGPKQRVFQPWLPPGQPQTKQMPPDRLKYCPFCSSRKQSGLRHCKEPFRAWWSHSGYPLPLFWGSEVYG